MKKVFMILAGLMLALVVSGCASIPKEVKKGDTLVIGRVDTHFVNYNQFVDIDMNNDLTASDYELVLEEVKSGRRINVKPNKDGYYFITGLTPHEIYEIVKLTVTKRGTSGASFSVWVDFQRGTRNSFIAYDSCIVNVGSFIYTFDGANANVNTRFSGYKEVYNNFMLLKNKQESEWFDKEVYEQ